MFLEGEPRHLSVLLGKLDFLPDFLKMAFLLISRIYLTSWWSRLMTTVPWILPAAIAWLKRSEIAILPTWSEYRIRACNSIIFVHKMYITI
jgi:hypothetical protein